MAILIGSGTEISTDLSGTSTPITQVESGSIPEIGTDIEEFEGLNDGNTYPTKIPVRNTYGDITVRVAYDPSVHAVLDTAAKALKSPGTTFEVAIGSYGTFDCVGIGAGEVTIEKKGILKRDYRFVVQGPAAT